MAPISEVDIQRYPEINQHVNEWYLTLKPTTLRLYGRYLIQFERISKITLETLLKKRQNHTITDTETRTLIINSTQRLTNSQQVVTDAAIRSFLKYWAVPIMAPTTIKYQEIRFYRAYTKEELNQLLSYLDKPLEKLYVLITAESGLRANIPLQLAWRHIKDDFNNRTYSIAIRLEPLFYKGKKKAGYTFIGTRSRQLLQYCVERQLISTQADAKLFPFSCSSISKIILTAKRKANLDPTIERIHGLRKYTEAQLEATKPPINERYRIMIMGRFKDIDAKNYSPRDFETLRPEYETAYPFIDYMNTAPQQAQELSNRQTRMQDTIDSLTREITQLKQEKHQIETSVQTETQRWAQLSDEQFNGFILYLRAKREQIKDPQHPLAKATDDQIIQAIKTISTNESSIVLSRNRIATP